MEHIKDIQELMKENTEKAKATGTGTFDYVAYDKHATELQKDFKETCMLFELAIKEALPEGRAKSLALTKLEELYMWIGKSLRDDQIKRNGSAELQEGRKDG